MNELILKLIACLEEEAVHYRRLTELAGQQKEMLMVGNTDILPENVRFQEREVFAIGPLATQRNDLLVQMAKMVGVKTLSLSEALQKAPLELIEDLKKAVIELVQSAKRLEETNQSNEKLLQNALSYVNFTLKVIANGGKKQAFSPSATVEEKKSTYVNRVV